MPSAALWMVLNFERYMLPCYTRKFLGVDCPGCGLQRAVLFFLKGEFTAAFNIYPAIYPMILLFTFLGLTKIIDLKHSNTITIALMVTTVAFIITNYILKFI